MESRLDDDDDDDEDDGDDGYICRSLCIAADVRRQ